MKSVQFRSVVSYRVIVVKPSDLGIVTVKDFKVVIIDKFRPVFGNPLLVPVMIAEFQHAEFQQFFFITSVVTFNLTLFPYTRDRLPRLFRFCRFDLRTVTSYPRNFAGFSV